MISEDDRCRCGHHRAHHVLTCKASRPVGNGSTPPGFRQHMERCPCLGFVLWRSAEQEETGRIEAGALVATFFVCVIGISLFALAVMGGRAGLCKVDPQGHRYCAEYQQAHR